MTFEVGKTYKTRDGREVRVVWRFTDGRLLVVDENRYWVVDGDGRLNRIDKFGDDLMPPRREVWLVWFGEGGHRVYFDEPAAQNAVRHLNGTLIGHFVEAEDGDE